MVCGCLSLEPHCWRKNLKLCFNWQQIFKGSSYTWKVTFLISQLKGKATGSKLVLKTERWPATLSRLFGDHWDPSPSKGPCVQEKVWDRKANPGGIVNPKKKAPEAAWDAVFSKGRLCLQLWSLQLLFPPSLAALQLDVVEAETEEITQGSTLLRARTTRRLSVTSLPAGPHKVKCWSTLPWGHVQSVSRMLETPGSLLPQVPHKKATQSPACVSIPGI